MSHQALSLPPEALPLRFCLSPGVCQKVLSQFQHRHSPSGLLQQCANVAYVVKSPLLGGFSAGYRGKHTYPDGFCGKPAEFLSVKPSSL
eukprot:1162045-Pelagomonas_calceolata.AAC.6